MLAVVKRWVADAGYAVETAVDGRAGLELAATNPPELILVDVMMPGMNGFDLCRRLRDQEQTKKTPLVIITALQAALDSEEGRMSGANEVLIKPLDRDLLVRKMRSYLRASLD